MAVGTLSAGGVSRGRDVLNGDTEGPILISGDLQDGWLRWGEEKDKDLRGQGTPKACGRLMGLKEAKRETRS